MTWIDFLNLLINGLIEGLVVALPALAMTLVMGVNRFPNAATGDMMTTGAYAAVAVQLLGGLPLWAAALGSMVVTAVVSAGSYQLIFRKLAGRPMVASMLAAIGLGFLLRSLISFFAGHDQRTFDLPLVRAWNFGGIRILPTDLAIAAVAAVSLMVNLRWRLSAMVLTDTAFCLLRKSPVVTSRTNLKAAPASRT